jgi:hypothetical protein
MSSSFPFPHQLPPGHSSSKIFIHRDVKDEEGHVQFKQGFIEVGTFLHYLNFGKPWRPLLPGKLRKDSAHPSPHIDGDGLIMVPTERYNITEPNGKYYTGTTRVFLQELAATGIPFDVISPYSRYNLNKHPEPNKVLASQCLLLPDGAFLQVPLLV